jgi:hypothetical protein
MILPRLAQRLHDGGNTHGQRCDPGVGRGKRNDDERQAGFVTYECVLSFKYTILCSEFHDPPGGEGTGSIQECGSTIKGMENVVDCATLL